MGILSIYSTDVVVTTKQRHNLNFKNTNAFMHKQLNSSSVLSPRNNVMIDI